MKLLIASACILGVLLVPVAAQESPFASGPVRLLASVNLTFPATSEVRVPHPSPESPIALSPWLTGAPLFTVDVPAGRRSHLILHTNASYTRHHVIAPARTFFTGALDVTFSSDVLPAPSAVTVTSLGLETIVEEDGPWSDRQASHVYPYSRAITIDETTIFNALSQPASPYAALPENERQRLAGALLGGAVTVTVTPKVRLRAMDYVRFSPLRTLQVWGG